MRLRLPLTFAGLALSTASGLLGVIVSSHPASAVEICVSAKADRDDA